MCLLSLSTCSLVSLMYTLLSGALLCPFYLSGRGDIQPQLDSAMQDVSDKYILLEETEKQALRKALVEDRLRICSFVAMLRPVVVSTAGRGERGKETCLKCSGNNKVILPTRVFAFNLLRTREDLFSIKVYSLSALYSLRTRRFLCWARSPTSRRSLMTSKP